MKFSLWIFLIGIILPVSASGKKEKPIVAFGVVTDLHYNNEIEVRGSRHHKATKRKLQEAVDTFNVRKVDFTVVLGDIIDFKLESFSDLKPIFASLKKPVYKVFGNHDFLGTYGTSKQAQVEKELGLEAPYYSKCKHGIRFLFLDSNDIGVLSRSADTPEGRQAREMLKHCKERQFNNAFEWNGTLSQLQQEWLLGQVQTAQRKHQMVICFAHMPLQPSTINARDFRGQELTEMLERYSCVKAFLSGHHHEGSMMLTEKMMHYGFQGMIEGEDNHFAIVKIYKNRLDIEGFGKQESRTVKFQNVW